MKEAIYIDKEGRKWLVHLPNDAPNSDANTGIPIGPPSLDDLELPETYAIALHNELFRRKIWTSKDIKHRRVEVIDALKSAYKVDAEKIYAHYLKWEGAL